MDVRRDRYDFYDVQQTTANTHSNNNATFSIRGIDSFNVSGGGNSFWLVSLLPSLYYRPIKSFIAVNSSIAALLLVLTVIANWALYTSSLLVLFTQGFYTVANVEAAFILFATLLSLVAYRCWPCQQGVSPVVDGALITSH